MSRIAKAPVVLPKGVESHIANGVVSVKGGKSTLKIGPPTSSLSSAQRSQVRGAERGLAVAAQLDDAARRQDSALRDLATRAERVQKRA